MQEKIGEKVFKNGKPTKFPTISENTYHVILVDMRGYLGGVLKGSNVYELKDDFIEIAYGKSGFKKDYKYLHKFNNKPIKGIFENGNPIESMKHIREKIHFIGFVQESIYGQEELLKQICYFGNLFVFNYNEKEINLIYKKMPFKNQEK